MQSKPKNYNYDDGQKLLLAKLVMQKEVTDLIAKYVKIKTTDAKEWSKTSPDKNRIQAIHAIRVDDTKEIAEAFEARYPVIKYWKGLTKEEAVKKFTRHIVDHLENMCNTAHPECKRKKTKRVNKEEAVEQPKVEEVTEKPAENTAPLSEYHESTIPGIFEHGTPDNTAEVHPAGNDASSDEPPSENSVQESAVLSDILAAIRELASNVKEHTSMIKSALFNLNGVFKDKNGYPEYDGFGYLLVNALEARQLRGILTKINNKLNESK